MCSSLIVDAASVEEAPKAFQEYVYKFFRKTTILGKDCYIAAMVLFWDHDDWYRITQHPERNKGRAPGHSVDMSVYKDGLPEGKSLSEWIHEQDGKTVWYVYGEERSSGSWVEDD